MPRMKHLHDSSGVKRNRLVSTLMSNYDSTMNDGQPFKLKSSSDFAVRINAVFDGLHSLEKEHEQKSSDVQVIDEKVVDSEEVCFKKPLDIACRKRRHPQRSVPDYIQHPEKWRKYSLADVPEHTNEVNNKAAMEFLHGIREERKPDDALKNAKVIFHSSGRKDKKSASGSKDDTEKVSFQSSGSVVMMPDCVVGRRKNSTRRMTLVNTEKRSELLLSHLEDVD